MLSHVESKRIKAKEASCGASGESGESGVILMSYSYTSTRTGKSHANVYVLVHHTCMRFSLKAHMVGPPVLPGLIL